MSFLIFYIYSGSFHEKKQKKSAKRKKKQKSELEKAILRETSSMSDAEGIYDKGEEIHRKDYEKRRMLLEASPKKRNMEILEAKNKKYDEDVTKKRMESIRKTSTDACKVETMKGGQRYLGRVVHRHLGRFPLISICFLPGITADKH